MIFRVSAAESNEKSGVFVRLRRTVYGTVTGGIPDRRASNAVVYITMCMLVLSALASASTCDCRYFWLVRNGLSSSGSVDSLLDVAANAGANGLFVQVVGRGEAYYRSGILPPAPRRENFDPLAYVIMKAHARGMEVHAWINAFLVWSDDVPPGNAAHVWHSHPEWFVMDRYGRSTRDYSRVECEAGGIVGATLSPAIPEVREFVASIACEIARNYDVDGIHLDYIRYPGEYFGFEPAAVGVFRLRTGMDPRDVYRREGGTRRVRDAWASWKRECVTATVEAVRAALRSCAPGVMLSAAVMADPTEAASRFSCDWISWLEYGLVDFVCPMAYTTNAARAVELAETVTAAAPRRVVYGIGIFNQSLSSALVGARRALAGGAGGVCVFSLNSFSRGDCDALKDFWGDGGIPVHPPDAAVYHKVSGNGGVAR